MAENAGRVALVRGPVVYCVEAVDNPGVDLRDLVLPSDATISEERRDEVLGGVTVLKARARLEPPGTEWAGRLYRVASGSASKVTRRGRAAGERREKPKPRETELVAVPYYAWANREPGRMQVWIRSE